MKSKNIADEDVVANTLTSEAEYEESEDSPRKHGKFIGYNVTRPFTVKVRDVAVFGKLVDELLALGVGEFTGIAEGLSEEQELKDQVWEKAVANARERAEKTLKSLGMKIDSVFAISPVAFPEIAQQIFGEAEAHLYKEAARTAAPYPRAPFARSGPERASPRARAAPTISASASPGSTSSAMSNDA